MNWIIVAISGAFFQNLRSTLQKKLNQKVSTIASTYVRFAFALPFGTILFFLYFQDLNVIPEILSQKKFIFNVLLGSIFQIIFTFVLLYLFRFANFVVGTSLSKTEVIQVAIFEYLIIGLVVACRASSFIYLSFLKQFRINGLSTAQAFL